jgi:hypothetical protein
MTIFIDLERRLRDLTKEELEEPEHLATMNDPRYGASISWADLLLHPRILLLAEAGSGKTIEMREQSKRLVAQGKFAFFLPLEGLDRDPLPAILSMREERAFDAWKADGRSVGWFFLDAVDELKLTEGKLDRALLKFAKAIDGHLHRAHTLISCRPSDWRPDFDMATVRTRLPLPSKQSEPIAPPDEIFLNALRREHGKRAPSASDQAENHEPSVSGVKSVVLLPLSDHQVDLFAKNSGVQDTAAPP